jgi:hypothetical protein
MKNVQMGGIWYFCWTLYEMGTFSCLKGKWINIRENYNKKHIILESSQACAKGLVLAAIKLSCDFLPGSNICKL